MGVYSKRGTFQLIAKRVSFEGKGDLKEQFDLLKKKLAKEGLFDLETKLPIPAFPKRVAIITAKQGAALQDFINIFSRRSLSMELIVVPSLVQGDTAAAAIRKSLHQTIKYSLNATDDKKIDVIVLARGGGSMEDLWCFNDEALAWDIYNCPIPIISAVGHQVDFSISDYVSDFRAETPSAAAEVLTGPQLQFRDRLENAKRHLIQLGTSQIRHLNHVIEQGHPIKLLSALQARIHQVTLKLERLSIFTEPLRALGLIDLMQRSDESIAIAKDRTLELVDTKNNRLAVLNGVVRTLNPGNVLLRGYSYLSGPDGKVVSRKQQFEELSTSERLEITFCDGKGTVRKDD